MSETYNAVFLSNADGTGSAYADTGQPSTSAPLPPEPIESDFTIDSTATLTTLSPSTTLTITRVTGTGSFLAYSSDTSVVTCSISGNSLILVGQSTGTATVTVTMSADGDYLACSKDVSVSCSIVELVSWSNGTDAQIAAMVAAADRGEIDLYEDAGWRVGDVRSVQLGAIASSGTYDGVSWNIGSSQSSGPREFVLLDRRLFSLVDALPSGRRVCSFVVGLRLLYGYSYMNPTATNEGSWSSSSARGWCNGGFRQAIPELLRSCFKKFKVTTGVYPNSTQSTEDYFTFAAEKEIFGVRTYSIPNEFSALTQFTYYKTASRRAKSDSSWWERGPSYDDDRFFCAVDRSGNAFHQNATTNFNYSPFGVI